MRFIRNFYREIKKKKGNYFWNYKNGDTANSCGQMRILDFVLNKHVTFQCFVF